VIEIKYFKLSMMEIIDHLNKVKESIREDDLNRLIGLIDNSRRIFLYGAGRSGFMARAFAQRLMHIGYESYFLGETVTPSCDKRDLIIIVSGSGKTISSLCLAEAAKEMGLKVVAITSHGESRLAEISDLTIIVPGKTKLVERESYAPFTSLFDISVLSFFDSVSSEIMRRKGINESKILERHATLE